MEVGCLEDFREVLNKHRVELIKKIDFDRQLLLAYLQSKNVLDEEDCQNIKGAGSSSQQKVSKFLDILSRKGSEGYQFFIKALELENGELFELLTGKKPQQSKYTVINITVIHVPQEHVPVHRHWTEDGTYERISGLS